MPTYKFKVKTSTPGNTSGSMLIDTTETAENPGFALSLCEAKYGKGNVIAGPIQDYSGNAYDKNKPFGYSDTYDNW